MLLHENGVIDRTTKKGESQINRCIVNLQVHLQNIYIVTQPVFLFFLNYLFDTREHLYKARRVTAASVLNCVLPSAID